MYYPEKEAEIKEIKIDLYRKLKFGYSVKIILINPDEEINITPNSPYKHAPKNIKYTRDLILEMIYSGRLVVFFKLLYIPT